MPRPWVPSIDTRGALAAVALAPRTVTVFSVGSPAVALRTLGDCGHDVLALRLHPTEDALYTLGGDRCLRAWDVRYDAPRWCWSEDSPGNELMQEDTAAQDTPAPRKPVRERQAGDSVRQYYCLQNEVSLYVEPSGTPGGLLVFSGPREVRVHECRTGRLLWRLPCFHTGHDASQCVVGDGRLVCVTKQVLDSSDWKAELDERAQVQLGAGGVELVAYGGKTGLLTPVELWRAELERGSEVRTANRAAVTTVQSDGRPQTRIGVIARSRLMKRGER